MKETTLRDFIAELLPQNMGVRSGFLIDQYGNESPQIDIIIYDKSILPILFIDSSKNSTHFPIETVLYIIEVKSTLTSQEIQKTIKNFKKIQSLKSSPRHLVRVLIGYNTDIKICSELQRYIKNDESMNRKNPAIQVILSINKCEYFYFKRENIPVGNRNILA